MPSIVPLQVLYEYGHSGYHGSLPVHGPERPLPIALTLLTQLCTRVCPIFHVEKRA